MQRKRKMLKFLSKLGPYSTLGLQLAVVWGTLHMYGEMGEAWVFGIGAALSVVLLFISYKVKNFLEAIPTSKIRSVAIGLSEIKGKTVGETKLISPLTKTKCYAYEYRIHSKNRSYKTNLITNAKVDRKDGYFYLDDGTGQLLCDTKGAAFGTKSTVKRGISVTKTETVVKPNQELFIIGNIKDNPFVKDATSVEGWKDLMMGDGEIYIISDKSEKTLRFWYTVSVITSGLSSFGLTIAGFLL
ncbi:MAG: hypothetical protein GOU98_02620 [Candidatus Altiarchaeota archaeon]|nr:hypothetical protein [Candidatus Altiarchaeota archaeon]